MAKSLKKYTLLLVEYEEKDRIDYSLYFKKFFKTVYEAIDGESGYQLYKKYRPDVLFLNMHLPKLSGLDLAQKIREEDKNIKIIMVSISSNNEELIKVIELKLSKYLLKPISKKNLKNSLIKLIEEFKELKKKSEKLFYFGDNIIWNQDRLYLTKDGEEIKLTKNEIRLLSLLTSTKDKIFSNEDIFATVWEDDFDKEFSIDSIKTLIKGIRKKLPKDTICNIYGEGYRLNPSIFKK